MVDHHRRNFFCGRTRHPPPLRPPWAQVEAQFSARCSRCADCLRSCPEQILIAGPGGYPIVDFGRGACTFCGACADACLPRALERNDPHPPWTLRAAIGPACLPHQGIECRICGDFCTPGAIRFRPRIGAAAAPEVSADACTGCGACVAPCPASAIAVLRPE